MRCEESEEASRGVLVYELSRRGEDAGGRGIVRESGRQRERERAGGEEGGEEAAGRGPAGAGAGAARGRLLAAVLEAMAARQPHPPPTMAPAPCTRAGHERCRGQRGERGASARGRPRARQILTRVCWISRLRALHHIVLVSACLIPYATAPSVNDDRGTTDTLSIYALEVAAVRVLPRRQQPRPRCARSWGPAA